MTFEGGYGWFQKKITVILRRKIFFREIAEEKKSYTEKKYLSWRIMWKKILHICLSRKNINSIARGLAEKKFLPKPNLPYSPHPPPPPPQKSNGRSLITLTRPVIYQNSCFISFHYIITCCSYFPRFLDEKDLPFKQKKA